MTDIVIYARFSSHNQNEQSIEGQLKACYQFAKQNDYNVIHEYIDRALSGTTDKRPEFLRMIEESKHKKFKYVLVYQLDRFARNRYDSAIYKSKLKKNGIRVLSARENISDDASGILMEGMLESMAEYYSAELSQKINRGMILNAEKCLFNGGIIPLGYYIDDEKRFQIKDDEAQTVQTIFNMYVKGSTMKEIIEHLNSLHIKTSRGNDFNKSSIRKILTNKRYIGHYIFKDYDVPDRIPRIVSDEIFNKAQKILAMNKKAPARAKAKEAYLLTTKLFCGLCDSPMTGISGTSATGKTYFYYTCNKSKNEKCRKKSVSKDYLENLVVSETKKLLTIEKINLIAKEIVELCKRESNTPTIQRLQRLIKENEKATNNLIKALEQGKAVDVIVDSIEKKKIELEDLKKQLVQENIKYPNLTLSEVKFFFNQFKNGDIQDIKYRESLINIFVRKIHLHEEKMTILYNVQDGLDSVALKPNSLFKDTMVENTRLELVTS